MGSHFLSVYKLYCFSRKIKSYALLLLFKNTVLFVCHRKPADLQNLAPGTHPPFITYNGEVKTDVNKIEEFLEDVLCPPKWVDEILCLSLCSPPHVSVNTPSNVNLIVSVPSDTPNSVPDIQNPTLQGWIYSPSSPPLSRTLNLMPMRVSRRFQQCTS